jgi:hypothetical protein
MLRAASIALVCLAVVPLESPFAAPSLSLIPVAERITVEQVNGSVSTAARVEPWPGGFVRLVGGGGSVSFIPVYEVRSIRADSGADATERVLRRCEGIGVAPVEPEIVGRPSPKEVPLRSRQEFVIAQGGVMGRFGAEARESWGSVTIDLGTLRNVSAKYAFGGTLGMVADEEYVRIAFKPRIRRWITNSLALDVAPGVFLPIDSESSPTNHGDVGFLCETTLALREWIGVTGQIEVVDRTRTQDPKDWRVTHEPAFTADSGIEVSYHLGAKLGGGAGTAAFITMLLTSLVVIADMNVDEY